MDNPVLCECDKNSHNKLEAVVEANDEYTPGQVIPYTWFSEKCFVFFDYLPD